ncbi:MAG TPA: fasciclin domain-containing protein [Chitinophagaceae bacterium]|nr:fasciclin domain-containing protein [Chitinophagaceae bacterium]
MKKIFRVAIPVMASFCALNSCQKTNNSNTSTATPVQTYLSSDTSLALYNALVIKANDSYMFTGTDSITMLAPTDSAFAAAGITAQTIAGWSTTAADSILRYHYIDANANLVSGSYTSFSSMLSPAIYGFTDGTNYYFNGRPAVKATLPSGTATIYKLGNVLQVPAASISQWLSADTSLSFFTEALTRTGLGASLGVSGWNTIFAPVNSAFISYGFTNVDTLDVNVLSNIMQYHILNGQYFSNTLASQVTVGAEEGGYINISSAAGTLQLTGTSNTSAATVLSANNLAGNVIVHKIDHLLLP